MVFYGIRLPVITQSFRSLIVVIRVNMTVFHVEKLVHLNIERLEIGMSFFLASQYEIRWEANSSFRICSGATLRNSCLTVSVNCLRYLFMAKLLYFTCWFSCSNMVLYSHVPGA